MKKFQGSNVPRPSMKKMSHTALYLDRKKAKVTYQPTLPPSQSSQLS